MIRHPLPIFGTAALLAAGLTACAGASASAGSPAPGSPSPQTAAATPASVAAQSPDAPATVALDDFERLYRERISQSQVVRSPADVAFMTRMIGHHTQAIRMSQLAPTHGANASIQTMAARIINAQTDEINLMRAWLSARGQPLPDEGDATHQHHEMDAMPGMLTPEQYLQLEAARGEEFDRLFLTFMIQHHRGAVQMVEELFSTDGAAQDEEVFKFASDTLADQGSEVARMNRMLESM
jgi:uncharacterized protein (DUF305 family)